MPILVNFWEREALLKESEATLQKEMEKENILKQELDDLGR